jgi:hypothetical protein
MRLLPHGFLYSHGSFTTVDVPGARNTWAHGINDGRQIVVPLRATGMSGADLWQHPFLRAHIDPALDQQTLRIDSSDSERHGSYRANLLACG